MSKGKILEKFIKDKYRFNSAWSLDDFANRAELDSITLQEIFETDELGDVSVKYVQKIAHAMQMSTDDLLEVVDGSEMLANHMYDKLFANYKLLDLSIVELTEKYKGTDYGMVQISNECLNAIIRSGALVAYVPIGHIDDLEENDIVLIEKQDSPIPQDVEPYIFRTDDNNYIFAVDSDNPMLKDKVVPKGQELNFKIVGKAIWSSTSPKARV